MVRGMRVALPAEEHRIFVTAAVTPYVKDPAFFPQRLPAAVADDDGFAFPANLANFSFHGLIHDFSTPIPGG